MSVHHDTPSSQEIWGFSLEYAARLTGISVRQLRYWDGTGFFSPRYGDENRRHPYSRVYSFRDLASLRVIAILRNKHRVPLQELRKVRDYLANQTESTWASVTFYVSGRRVFFDDPTTGIRVSGRRLQPVLPIAMQRIAEEISRAAKRLRRRAPEDIGKVTRHRYVVHNEPVLEGTRISTRSVWNLYKAGYGPRKIIREYPELKAQDVRAAIAYEEAHKRKKAS